MTQMDVQDRNIQKFTTLLGFSLPVIQFFYGLLSKDVASIFLFGEYFLIVSVFTVVVSYIMIIAFKTRLHFTWAPLQKRRVRKLRNWHNRTNPSIFKTEEIADYIKSNQEPKYPFEINADNISQKMFLPIILLCFITFYFLGLRFGVIQEFKLNSTSMVIVSLVQGVAYSLFVTFVVLAFAIQYLTDNVSRDWESKNKNQFHKMITLARKQNAFKEYKNISSIAYQVLKDEQGFNTNHAYLLNVEGVYYIIVCDINLFRIDLVVELDNLDDAKEKFWS